MKKILLTFVLLVGVVFGLFAQKLTYQAVIRDNNQQLVTNTAVTANVVVKVGGTSVYTETVNGTTNNHGLLDIQFGNATLSNIDWPNATISVQVKNATTQVVYIPIEDRPVSAVPYALYAVNSASSQGSAGGISIVVKANESSCETIGDSYIDDNGHLQILTSTDPRVFTDAGEIRGPQGPQGIQGPQGPKGDTGENGADGIGISSITGPVTSDLQDTYTINYTNGTTSTFVVTNGAQGEQGPAGESVEQVQADWAESDTTSKSFIKNKPTFPTSDQDLAELLQGLQNQINALQNTVASQDSTINALNNQVNPFVCGSSKVKDVDSNEYNTVKIGNQCWMKENLKTTKKPNGDAIAEGVYVPNGDSSKVETYGRLYTWSVVMNGAGSTNYPDEGEKVQGICPAGWHVPSDAEWTQLTNYVNIEVNGYRCDGDGTIANALSAATGWNSSTSSGCNAGNTGDKANATGFSAVSAGGCFNGDSNAFGDNAYFWSATQNGGKTACSRTLHGSDSLVHKGNGYKGNGYSVRCLRDAGVGGGDEPSTPGEVSCEQVMECMGDTLGRLNARITTQGETITAQGNTIDSLTHIVDSLSKLPHGGDTPTEVADGQPCPGAAKVQDADGNEYNTVKIGNQCWTKENLRTNVNGGVYPKRGDETVTGEDTITYGRLYTWDAMMNNTASTNYPESGSKVQGICPEGWHVPSDAEWTKLTTYVKSVSEYVCDGCSGTDDEWYTNCIAKALSQPTWWSNTGTGCNAGNTGDKANLTGFSAVPAGYCFGGNSYDFGSNASFWSATQYGDYVAWCRNLASSGSGVNRGSDDKDVGFSVRCLRDAGIGGGDEPSTPGEVSCEQVMECMADTLSRLNARITSQGETITAQGNTIDSLAHIVDSLSNITPVTPDTPVTPTDTFNCGTSKVKDVDNNEYNTVKIGNQCWMKENLRTKTHQYGQVWTKTDVDSAIYGRYYDWQAAMQIERGNSTSYYTAGDKHRGICPEGWHVPSHAEWTALTDYVKSKSEYQCGGNAANIAKALSSPTGWNSNTYEDCNAGNTGDKANATGFSAVPAGFYHDFFSRFGERAYFWSATQKTDYEAWYRYLDSSDSYVYSSSDYKENGFSVRCLRDAGIGGGDEPSEPVPPVTPTDTFDCGTDKVKDVQNNEYNTVQIGNQCWMKENLRTNVGTGDYGYPTGVSGTADTVTYGRLYSWAAVMQTAAASSDVPSRIRGICPEGWHVPSDGEWGNLINYVKSKPNEYKCGDDANNIANALSSETGWTNGSTPGCNAGDDSEKRNQTGFSAVPAGYFDTSSTNKGTHAYFWSTTDSGSAVYYRYLDNTSSSMNSGFEFSEDMGLSVRCLRN